MTSVVGLDFVTTGSELPPLPAAHLGPSLLSGTLRLRGRQVCPSPPARAFPTEHHLASFSPATR